MYLTKNPYINYNRASLKGSISGWLGTNRASHMIESRVSWQKIEKEYLSRKTAKGKYFAKTYKENLNEGRKILRNIISHRRNKIHFNDKEKKAIAKSMDKCVLLESIRNKIKIMDITNLTREQKDLLTTVMIYASQEISDLQNGLAKTE